MVNTNTGISERLFIFGGNYARLPYWAQLRWQERNELLHLLTLHKPH